MTKLAMGTVGALALALLSGCQQTAARSAPAATPAAASDGQSNWLEKTGDATWSIITLPMRALTPTKPAARREVERDPPARLVVAPNHAATAPAEATAPARLDAPDSAQ